MRDKHFFGTAFLSSVFVEYWTIQKKKHPVMRACGLTFLLSDVLISLRCSVMKVSEKKPNKDFRCRCACGKHPFPSRTRWLSRRRPTILYWRRYGKIGGCRDSKNNSRSWLKIEQAEEGSFRDCQPGPAGKGCYRIENYWSLPVIKDFKKDWGF